MKKVVWFLIILILILVGAYFIRNFMLIGTKSWRCAGELNQKVRGDAKHYIPEDEEFAILKWPWRNIELFQGEECKVAFLIKLEDLTREAQYKLRLASPGSIPTECGKEASEIESWVQEDEGTLELIDEDKRGYGFLHLKIPEDSPLCEPSFNLTIYREGEIITEKKFFIEINPR